MHFCKTIQVYMLLNSYMLNNIQDGHPCGSLCIASKRIKVDTSFQVQQAILTPKNSGK